MGEENRVRKFIWVVVFGIAFGLVEASVVVYLRSLYYPEGFHFPTGRLPTDILRTEIIREGATLVILIAIGALAGATRVAKFGAFMTVFGVWDIFYYVWLKLFLDWPETLLDWDILFLIPGPWAGPIIAPILVSMAFIGCGGWLFAREESGRPVNATPRDWIVEITAGLVMVSPFLLSGREPMPVSFPWWLFLTGLLGGVGYFVWRMVKS